MWLIEILISTNIHSMLKEINCKFLVVERAANSKFTECHILI